MTKSSNKPLPSVHSGQHKIVQEPQTVLRVKLVQRRVFARLRKFKLLVRMTQNRKTGITINHIKKIYTEAPEKLHFIYTMNTILNNKQFESRVKNSGIDPNSIVRISHRGITSTAWINLHNKYIQRTTQRNTRRNRNPIKAPCLHLSSISDLIALWTNRVINLGARVKVVLMCGNASRFDNIDRFINETGVNTPEMINVYYDEIHSVIDTVRETIENFDANPVISEVIGLTATPKNVFKSNTNYWNRVKIWNNTEIDTRLYCGTDDIDFRNFPKNDHETSISYIRRVVADNPDVLQAGNMVFIPADSATASHNTVRNFIVQRVPDAIVIVINGREKNATVVQDTNQDDDDVQMYVHGDNPRRFPLGTTEKELSVEISDIIRQNNFENRLIVVTGLICVGQGQTFADINHKYFTHGIISHNYMSDDMLYQLFGRMSGNHKTGLFQNPILFTTENIWDRIVANEQRSKVCGILYRDQYISFQQYLDSTNRINEADTKLRHINYILNLTEEFTIDRELDQDFINDIQAIMLDDTHDEFHHECKRKLKYLLEMSYNSMIESFNFNKHIITEELRDAINNTITSSLDLCEDIQPLRTHMTITNIIEEYRNIILQEEFINELDYNEEFINELDDSEDTEDDPEYSA